VGGLISLTAGDHIRLAPGANLVGTNPLDARIIGSSTGGLIRANPAFFGQIQNVTVSNTDATSGACAIRIEVGGGSSSGAPTYEISNCFLQGICCILASSGFFLVNECRLTVLASDFGIFSSGICTDVAVTAVRIRDCDFVQSGGFGIGIANTLQNSSITDCRFYGIDGSGGFASPGSAGIRTATVITKVNFTNNEFYQSASNDNNRGIITSNINFCALTNNRSYLSSGAVTTNSPFLLHCGNAVGCQFTDNYSDTSLYSISGAANSTQISGGVANAFGVWFQNDAATCQINGLVSNEGHAVAIGNASVAESSISNVRGLLSCLNFLNSGGELTVSQVTDCYAENMIYYGPGVSGALINSGTLVTGCKSRVAFINGDGTSTFPAWTAVGFPGIASFGNQQNNSVLIANYPLNFP
jgi:hypothetical protein